MFFGLLVFGAIVGGVLWFVTAYNTLVAAAQRAAQAWGNIDALLRQRHDEIPKLLETYQQYVKYEQATFDRVLEARSAIFGARQTADVAALSSAENALRGELRKLRTLAESHLDLQADETFGVLRQRLTTLETGIDERRAIYNDAVRQNNIAIGQFPGVIVAGLGDFRTLEPFEFDPA